MASIKIALDVTRVTSSQEVTLGTIYEDAANSKAYKYVKILNTTATVAGAAGDLACFDAEDGISIHTVVLDKSDADAVPLGAGLLAGTVTGTAGTAEYGWIQVSGPATALQTLAGSPSDGQPLSAAGADKVMTLAQTGTGTAGPLDQVAVCAWANDASAKTVVCMFPR